ncbi:MAG: asparagine synthase (glutamine-hydrolyzing) [Chitinophagaceae bacterium]|nr:MAG: asparagine synthase (glutamine-hydrolyzing) [Chitinophagaceae bacterium]
MCGLAGIVTVITEQTELRSAVEEMTTAMKHRGPDAVEFFVREGICLGHRRLSIIDLSTAANQPFTDVSGKYHIIFNGEIYNFKSVKEQLTGYPFVTEGDTEVLLASYIEWGPACLRKLEGMFSFAIFEEHTGKLFIARDRVGVKPLYYYSDEQHFVFASEVRGMLASGMVPKKLNKDAVREFFSYQSIGSNISIIKDVYQLPAGCYMTFENHRPEIKRYWDPSDKSEMEPGNDRNQILKQTRRLLLESVSKRLVSDVPIGAFLSGGIDSSAVVALMAECQDDPVNTFTVGFNEPDFDESEYAGIIASKFKTNHSRVLLEPQSFLDELLNSLDAMDTPSGDGVNTYVVSKAIRQSGLTVALSGIGGDELFAGYPFFKQFLKLRKLKIAWPLVKAGGAAIKVAKNIGAAAVSDKLINLATAKGDSIEYLYPEFRRVISPQLLSKITKLDSTRPALVQSELQKMADKIHSFPQLSQVTIAELKGYTQHTLLKDTDQMSMAVSLEVREPFFDHKLISYVLAIPDSVKRPSYPKQLLVESLGDLLPREIVFRKKKGFVLPWNQWMKESLREFCEQRLHRIAERDFVNKIELLEHWQKFLSGDPSARWMEIWLFVTLEYWLEKNGL